MVQFDFIHESPAESGEEFWVLLTFSATDWRLMGRAIQVYWGALINIPSDSELNNLLEPVDSIETPLALVDAPRVVKELESAIINSELIAFFDSLAKGAPGTLEKFDPGDEGEQLAIGIFILQVVPRGGPQLLNGMIDYGSLDALIMASSVMRNILRIKGAIEQLKPLILNYQPQLILSADLERYAEDYARFTRTLIRAEETSAYKLEDEVWILHQ